MAVNAYGEIDTVVYDAFRTRPAITSIVAPENIRVWDRAVDLRDDPDGVAESFARLWIVPLASSLAVAATSTSALIHRRYSVGFSPGSLSLVDLRRLEWNVHCAAVTLTNGPWPATFLPIELIELEDTDPERLPADVPEEWRDVVGIKVQIQHPTALFEDEAV